MLILEQEQLSSLYFSVGISHSPIYQLARRFFPSRLLKGLEEGREGKRAGNSTAKTTLSFYWTLPDHAVKPLMMASPSEKGSFQDYKRAPTRNLVESDRSTTEIVVLFVTDIRVWNKQPEEHWLSCCYAACPVLACFKCNKLIYRIKERCGSAKVDGIHWFVKTCCSDSGQ